ncbi:hypothetical protein KCU78_g6668, partial [Aureobasidium melanogenum]
MSTPNYNAATIIAIHGSINTATAAKGIASRSQDNKLFPSENNSSSSSQNNSYPAQSIINQSSADNNTSNPTNANPTFLPSHGSVTPSILQTSTAIDKPRNKKKHENIKDWDKMTLAERLEATTDLPLTPFSEYEWKVENELPYLSPWPARQQRKS